MLAGLYLQYVSHYARALQKPHFIKGSSSTGTLEGMLQCMMGNPSAVSGQITASAQTETLMVFITYVFFN